MISREIANMTNISAMNYNNANYAYATYDTGADNGETEHMRT